MGGERRGGGFGYVAPQHNMTWTTNLIHHMIYLDLSSYFIFPILDLFTDFAAWILVSTNLNLSFYDEINTKNIAFFIC